MERGFAGTTTKAIAAAAGVAEKTLFLTFPSKAALLSEVIRVGVRGDDPDERLAESAAWQAMLRLPPSALIDAFAHKIAAIHERTARIVAVAEAAAAASRHPELMARRDLGHASSYATTKTVVDALAQAGALDPALTPDTAADALDALASDAVYLRLVDERGWTGDRYANWLATALTAIFTPR